MISKQNYHIHRDLKENCHTSKKLLNHIFVTHTAIFSQILQPGWSKQTLATTKVYFTVLYTVSPNVYFSCSKFFF